MNARTCKRLAQTDPVMARLMKEAGPIRLKPRRLAPYESLIRAIIYQQISGRAAETILGRFCEQIGAGAFPNPTQILSATPERLRAAGLSRQKSGYLLDLADHARQGLIPTLEECDDLSDEALIERLTEIKGVGRWTVEMLLIFNLGRPDVLPVDDLGVQKGFKIAYGKRTLPKPKQLAKFGERWKPFRTTAAWYLWRAADGA